MGTKMNKQFKNKQNKVEEVEAGFWGVAPLAERKPWLKRRAEKAEKAAAAKAEEKKTVKVEKEEQKPAPKAVFVKKVENFDWFGATVSTCMHCGKTGHKGTECPDYKPNYDEPK